MYCPVCGGKLKLVPRIEPEEIDWCKDYPAEELKKLLDAWNNFDEDYREEYECIGKGCFKPDYPLYFHHPFRGVESKPGESWSLSWVK